MARRLDKTLIDYLVIAISPALIMVLIGSLIYFLLEVFYRGQYEIRLHYILTLFIIGAVLIGRISIEQGKERAALFAGPLAVVTLLAINKFVDLPGVPSSTLINCGLIGLIWWCAHKLTWDCTLIDESEPDSGEGLLEAVGLDKPAKAQAAAQTGKKQEPEGTTSRQERPAGWHERMADWWARFVQRRRRPHAPGLWVVYFSLAALPLFGIGQLCVPAGNLESRRYVFHLLFVYVASGLGLLLATSFLGLRRYLRQRRMEMPVPMVNVWIVIGCALIAAVMGLALLLPRPNPEYAVSELSLTFGSLGQKSSRYGTGKEGVEENKPWSRADKMDEKGTLQSDKPGDKGQSPSDQRGGKGQSQSGQQETKGTPSPGKQQPDAEAQSGKTDQKGQPGSDNKDAAGKSQPAKQDAKGEGASGKSEAEGKSPSESGNTGRGQDTSKAKRDADQTKAKTASSSLESRGSSQDQPDRDKKRPDDAQQSKTGSGGQGSSRAPQDRGKPPSAPRFSPPALSAWAVTLFKWVFYAAIIVLAAWWLRRNWAAVLAALRDFWKGWREFWHNLFGRKRERSDEAAEAAQDGRQSLQRSFADFADPFAAGRAARCSPEELVEYTFLALEAWAREHGCARQPDQTPHEFARSVGERAASLADAARRLADWYCQVAYGSGALPASSIDHVRQVWQNFPREPAAAHAAIG